MFLMFRAALCGAFFLGSLLGQGPAAGVSESELGGNIVLELPTPLSTAALSRNGQWVALITHISLVPEDTDSDSDLYIVEMVDGVSVLVPVGDELPEPVPVPVAVSDDGNIVVVHGFVGDDLVVDASTATATLLPSSDPTALDASADGRLVLFTSSASLDPQRPSTDQQLFLLDRTTGGVELVSLDAAGQPITGGVGLGAIGGSGDSVAFISPESAPDFCLPCQLQVRDRGGSSTSTIFETSVGEMDELRVSDDGSVTVASQGLGGAVGGFGAKGELHVVSAGGQVTSATEGLPLSGSNVSGIRLSGDGGYLTFYSDSASLFNAADFYIRNNTLGASDRHIVTHNGAQAFIDGIWGVSGDGRFLGVTLSETAELHSETETVVVIDRCGSTSSGFEAIAAANAGGATILACAQGWFRVIGQTEIDLQPPLAVLHSPLVAMAVTPTENGVLAVGADGGVFAFGDARYLGSLAGTPLSGDIVAIAPTASGNGYWLVGADGGVFAFGDAGYLGSLAGSSLAGEIVAIAPSASGNGYWLVGADGGVFAFGDAPYLGSLAGTPLSGDIVAIAPTSPGSGYWLVGADGGVFAFGDAPYLGSLAGSELSAEIVAFVPTPTGNGYTLIAADGETSSFGDAA